METEFDNIEVNQNENNQNETEFDENQIQFDFDAMMQSIAMIQYNKELINDKLKPTKYKIALLDDSENTADEDSVRFSLYFSRNCNFSHLYLWKYRLSENELMEVFEKYVEVDVDEIIKELEKCLN